MLAVELLPTDAKAVELFKNMISFILVSVCFLNKFGVLLQVCILVNFVFDLNLSPRYMLLFYSQHQEFYCKMD